MAKWVEKRNEGIKNTVTAEELKSYYLGRNFDGEEPNFDDKNDPKASVVTYENNNEESFGTSLADLLNNL